MINLQDIFIETPDGNRLWMGRMGNENGHPVLLVHGAIENGRIFYSSKGKGLAPFLAQKGFDVFVVDLRGKGNSTPAANTGKSTGGQFEVITHDIPAYIAKIRALKGVDNRIHLMAHSWGGVLLAAWFARFKDEKIAGMTFFASKRKIYVHHIKRWLMVDLAWTCLGSLATLIKGYLPAIKLKMGSDNEPSRFFFECNKWVYSTHWIDPRDRFNYQAAFKEVKFPPVMSLTGSKDHSLGNKVCVKKLLKEINADHSLFQLLGKQTGFKQDYDHINILTHPDATNDHFQLVVNWLNQHK